MNRPLLGSVDGADLHVMSFNIRRRMGWLSWRAVDRWEARRPRLQKLLRIERPTLLGVQEALPDQAQAVLAALGADYRFIGHGRESGRRGEACPMFYDSARLELIHAAQDALSDHPAVAGSRSWGNLIPRVIVRATFRDRATTAVFAAINTHLDPFSQQSRVRAARSIRHQIARQTLPAIVMGDLNAGPGTPAVRELFAAGTLRDAWAASSERLTPEWETFTNYRRPRVGRRIDWIAVTSDVHVLRAGINARRVGGRWPSDHLPVQAVVRVPRGGEAT